MDGHSFCAQYVRGDEPVSSLDTLELDIWTRRSHGLLHVDCQSEELSADADQCGSRNPVRHRVIPAFWLTQ
jgi:hypothetical protein